MIEEEKLSRVIALAQKEVGVTEMPSGSNRVKFNTWFYGKVVEDDRKLKKFFPWCFTFCSYVYNFAGFNLGVIDYIRGGASCPYGLRNISKWGKIVTTPKPGYLVMFDWNLDRNPDHIGIFLRDNGDGKTFTAIEGNTAIGNDSNGGTVMVRTDRKYSVAIFIRPNSLDKDPNPKPV